MPTRESVKLTKRVVDAIKPPAEGFVRVWDTDVKGFHVRARANGRKTYELKYRVGRRQATYTIGDHGTFTAEEAREEAEEAKRTVRRGHDPLAARKARRDAATVRDLIDRYLERGPIDRPTKRASSWETDRINLRRHVEPLLGTRAACDLTPSDLARWQRDVAEGKTAWRAKSRAERATGSADSAANKKRGRTIVRGGKGGAARAMCSLSAMLSWAVRDGSIPENPARKVEKLPGARRERFLTEDEAARLWATVAAMEVASENPLRADPADLFRLLALTGARRAEILELRWKEIDWDRGRIVLPPERHKTGSKGRERVIHLDSTAVEILRRRQRAVIKRNAKLKRIVPWVFPKADGSGPIEPPKRAWNAVRKAASLPDLRLHDLRHTYASLLLQDGVPLALVGKALGHTKAATTERYAHLKDDATKRGAQHVASIFTRPTTRGSDA